LHTNNSIKTIQNNQPQNRYEKIDKKTIKKNNKTKNKCLTSFSFYGEHIQLYNYITHTNGKLFSTYIYDIMYTIKYITLKILYT
jgi:hypothetical protein